MTGEIDLDRFVIERECRSKPVGYWKAVRKTVWDIQNQEGPLTDKQQSYLLRIQAHLLTARKGRGGNRRVRKALLSKEKFFEEYLKNMRDSKNPGGDVAKKVLKEISKNPVKERGDRGYILAAKSLEDQAVVKDLWQKAMKKYRRGKYGAKATIKTKPKKKRRRSTDS